MKNKLRLMSVLLSCGALLFSACNKEETVEPLAESDQQTRAHDAELMVDYADDMFIPKEDEFAAIFDENRFNNTEVFEADANEPITIVTEGGVILELPANALETEGGEIVEGGVRVFFNGITDRAEMVIQDRGTTGINLDGTGESSLFSGGEFFIEIRSGVEPLVLNAPMTVSVPTADPDPEMQLFVEAEGTGDDLLWQLAPDRPVTIVDREPIGEGDGGTYFQFNILPALGNQWGWINIDKFNADRCTPDDASEVSVELPAGNDPTNSKVYIIECGQTNRVLTLWRWDAATNSFLSPGAGICPDLCVHFILVTNVNGTLEYSIHSSVTINPGSHTEVFTAPFTAGSSASLAALINALP